jgi:hypothetical protein
MGKRIDVILLIGPVLLVLEFKVGETEFTASALDQVCDYGLDLKNFLESSRDVVIAPILIATRAGQVPFAAVSTTPHKDRLLSPNRCNAEGLGPLIEAVLSFTADEPEIDADVGARALLPKADDHRSSPRSLQGEFSKKRNLGGVLSNKTEAEGSQKYGVLEAFFAGQRGRCLALLPQ